MPIYSTNRVSGASTRIVAAENYTEHDFGRILSECATNDMRLFNAAIARDFQEITAMQEGTMMSSEIYALREFSVKEAWKGLVEKLKKLWAKIKGVFRNVYAKLSLWLNRNNKLYVLQNRKYLNTKKLTGCPLPKFRVPDGDFREVASNIGEITKFLDAYNGDFNDKGDFVKTRNDFFETLGISVTRDDNSSTISADGIYEKLLDKYFKKPNDKLKWPIASLSLERVYSDLGASSKFLKNLKDASRNCDKAFKSVIRKVEDAQNEYKKDNDGKENEKYKFYSKAVSEFQSMMNATTSAYIKLTKKAINNERGLIAALVAFDPEKATHENAIMCEFAYATGYYALHEETDDMSPEDIQDAADDEGITVDINVSVDGDAHVGDVDVDDD